MANPLAMLALEITGACQLQCTNCYADSGPDRTHGPLTEADWVRHIREGATPGFTLVQFIGGEPTLNPMLPALVEAALSHGCPVEVYTNLMHVTEQMWALLTRDGVSVATSYYGQGEEFTSHTKRPARLAEGWWKNVERARSLGIAVRVALGDATSDSDTVADRLASLGATQRWDRERALGRGAGEEGNTISELCGRCTGDTAAILPTGEVSPCTMGRAHVFGSVRESSLQELLDSPQRAAVRQALDAEFAVQRAALCGPGDCTPSCQPCLPYSVREPVHQHRADCNPQNCWPSCSPGNEPVVGPEHAGHHTQECYPSCTPGCAPMSDCLPRNPFVPSQGSAGQSVSVELSTTPLS